VEHLANKWKVLTSNPSTVKEEEEEERNSATAMVFWVFHEYYVHKL
jgi:hypothetical protein